MMNSSKTNNAAARWRLLTNFAGKHVFESEVAIALTHCFCKSPDVKNINRPRTKHRGREGKGKGMRRGNAKGWPGGKKFEPDTQVLRAGVVFVRMRAHSKYFML